MHNFTTKYACYWCKREAACEYETAPDNPWEKIPLDWYRIVAPGWVSEFDTYACMMAWLLRRMTGG